MDPIHPAHATADPLFYDRPRIAEHRAFAPSAACDWGKWRNVQDDHWTHWSSPVSTLPDQGWKVHVSATPDTASTVLEMASQYCHGADLPFKYLTDVHRLNATLAKDADRTRAGKFVTIYPSSLAELESCLTALDQQLGGLPGPYILTDLRWNSGPVHVRYGAFTFQEVLHDGVRVPAVRDVNSGALVPDVRGTSFVVPSWVSVPGFLHDQMQRLQTTPPRWFPAVDRVVQHSNAGGVYEATIGAAPVILKEGRPFTGYTPDGRDAVTRLRDEEEALRAVELDDVAPAVVTSFELHGHRFLATERVPGRPLSAAVASRNPLGGRIATATELRAYRDWALAVAANIRDAVAAIHRSGRTHGDLHPGNVLVDDVGKVTLIDFEMSQPVDSERAASFGVPGFVAPATSSPVLRDLFAAACIELHMFVPLTPLLYLDARKLQELTTFASSTFDLPIEWTRQVTARLSRGLRTRRNAFAAEESPRSVDAVLHGLRVDADATRVDRLWPGDPRQFAEESFALAHGALGVAMTLNAAGVDVDGHIREWIADAIFARQPDSRLGLMDGIAGAMLACRRIGWHDLADELLHELIGRHMEATSADLYSGDAGIALALLSEAAAKPWLRDLAVRKVGGLQPAAGDDDRIPHSRRRAGLMRGPSGVAIALLHAYRATADTHLLSAARAHLDLDVRSLVESVDGGLHVDEGWRALPYLGAGSAGVGLVIAEYQAATGDDGSYGQTLEKITAAACTPFTAQVGLLQGRAGLIEYLRRVDRLGFGDTSVKDALVHHTEQLWLHALNGGEGTRFVGDGLLRASDDLATGAAGALACLLDRPALPFLVPPEWGPATEVAGGGEVHGVSVVAAVSGAR